MQYDKWTHEKAISPIMLMKMITVMEGMNQKEQKPILITETHRMSILNTAITVCKRRYGVLRLLADYRLILQSALYYAKQCDLIKNEKTFMDAID
uniref:NR LBD domain-containing protein n=1 Tax=Loa loa TaxID=7209 RepID=A0A1I7VBS1_LOALO